MSVIEIIVTVFYLRDLQIIIIWLIKKVVQVFRKWKLVPVFTC